MNSRVDKDDSFYRSFDGPSLVSHDSSTHQNITADPAARAAQEEEWRTDLAKLESEITTLTSVLNAKQRQAAELKRRLGLTPLQELRRDLEHGVQNIKQSDVNRRVSSESIERVVNEIAVPPKLIFDCSLALEDLPKDWYQVIVHQSAETVTNPQQTDVDLYKNTNEKLVQISDTISSTDAYQKTNSAFKSLGSFASRKLGDLRNSGLYKSVEEKVGDAYTSVKSTLSTSRSASNVNVMPGSPIDSLLEDDEVYNSSSRQPVATGIAVLPNMLYVRKSVKLKTNQLLTRKLEHLIALIQNSQFAEAALRS